MKRVILTSLMVLALAVAGSADARGKRVTDADYPRQLTTASAVSVDWTDPNQFTDIRYSGNRWEAAQGNWVVDLATYLQKQAGKKLANGQQLHVTITDIRRAGMYEPGRGMNLDRVRIIKDIYPPRMTLNFSLTGADGQVISEGERKLVDSAFLMGSGLVSDTDPLRYEKRMLDDWINKELGQKGV
ncbi:DUF3016 domain-containing protein [Pseudoxanthomonas indica]|uniref:DUF3016 domain-containing protein n=1 Tax=Pseudoxanthomonas indica TaxID=428993 RepID=A0A1T5K7C6_9GAMM|nr:DUF3016 domain-containing protein [Pseudoxanthomonas indica]GGD47153.1 membrane protein [Pseudoxanthomonas indica]SKC59369.1 Protein of unknown function [Pseudoxanthomonas indica]